MIRLELKALSHLCNIIQYGLFLSDNLLIPCQTDQRHSDCAQFESALPSKEKQSNCLINVCAFDFTHTHAYPSSQKRCQQNHIFLPKITLLFQEPRRKIHKEGDGGGGIERATENKPSSGNRIKQPEEWVSLWNLASFTVISTANTWERIHLFVDYQLHILFVKYIFINRLRIWANGPFANIHMICGKG